MTTIASSTQDEFGLLSPAGGENWTPASQQQVEWLSTRGEYVNIELRNGQTYSTTTANVRVAATDGDENGTFVAAGLVANKFPKGSSFTVANSQVGNNGPYTVKSVTESGGSTYIVVDTIIVANEAAGNLDLLTSNYVQVIAQNVESYSSASNKYELGWKIDPSTPVGIDYKVRVTTLGANPAPTGAYPLFRRSHTRRPPVSVESKDYFSISEPYIAVTAPNGGESFNAGQSNNITWQTNASGEVKVELLKGNYTISAVAYTFGSYVVTLAGDYADVFSTADAKVKIYQSSNNDGVYAVARAVYEAGVGTKLTLSDNLPSFTGALGYASWYSSIIFATSNDGTYAWTIPYNLPIGEGKDYRVRIESITSPWKGTGGESSANFSIFNNAMVTVISPNGGENWLRGVQREILWRSNAGGTVNIDLVRGESEAVVSNITQSALNSNDSSVVSSYTWSIPDDANLIPAANDYKIRIMVVDAANAEDVSDANFSITSVPSISVEAPAAGDSLKAGMSETLTWVSNVGGDVKLELYDFTDSAVALLTIAESVDNRNSSSSFSWTVPLSLASGNSYFIKVSSLFSGKNISGSSGKFSIVAVPYIKVIYPNGGESLDFGGTHNVTWSTNIDTVLGGRQYVKIELLNNEVPVATSASGLPESIDNTQSFTWTIPAVSPAMPAGSLYKIRISCVGNSSVVDSSDAYFTLGQPGIKIISPATSVRWAPGREYNIVWTTNLSGSVKIDLLKAGVVVSTINGNAPNTGVYSWAIPAGLTPGADYQIQISHNSSTESDTSGLFSIDGAAYIQLATPNGSEKWPVGFERSIIWGSNAGGTVKIELYKNNAFYLLLTSGLANSAGSYLWPIPTSLPVGDSYKIKVSSEDDVFVYDISDGNFSIQNPNLTVNTPNGGEFWAMGSTQLVSWSSNVMGNVRLELYQDSNLKKVIASSAPNISATNEYNWTITADDSLSLASNYKIRVTSVIDATVYDESDAQFSITAPYVTVTAPNGGENWSKGLEQQIFWSSNIGGSVEISLYKGGTLSQTIASSTPNDGSYLWTVPASLETGTDYRVQIKSKETLTRDISDGNFTITTNDIQIVQPNGGENWSPGRTYGVKWTSALGGNVELDLYKTGVLQSVIAASTPNDGYYEWAIPSNQMLGTDYSVMITSVENPLVSKSSDSSFSITRFITVLSPNGGERIARGVSMPVTWSSNVSDNVNIYLYHEVSGALVYHSTLASDIDNSGAFAWAIPATLDAGNYSITITSVADALVTDSSNAVFVVEATQTLLVTAPNGGESWGIGTRRSVTWTSNMGGTVDIALLGGSSTITIASGVANNGNYLWLIPDDGTISAGNAYTISITCGSVTDTSDASFTLSPEAYITLTYPIGGEILAKGFPATIAWNKNVGGNVNIYLLKSGNSTTLASGLSNIGSYTWDVPSGQEIGADYQVKVVSVENSGVFGVSNANFSIAEPKLTVTAPANGVAWGVGTTQGIAWTSNFPGSVNIDLYKAGAFVRSIAKAVANSGAYSWAGIPALADGADYSVKVSSVAVDSAYGLSDPFSIGPRSITVSTPAAGASWAVGSTYQIAWESNIDGNAALELGTYSDGVFTAILTINGATALSSGSYGWTIPSSVADGDNYRIRLTRTKYGDTSLNLGAFSIRKPFIAVLTPNGGEIWRKQTEKTITWSSNIEGNVSIDLLKGRELLLVLAPSTEAKSGTFQWAVPISLADGSDYAVEITSVDTPVVDDQSTYFFQIAPAIFTLNYAAGENGSLTGADSQIVEYGTSGTAVEAVANTGYHFIFWSDGSTANPRTDTNVIAAISVTASFAINTYTLAYTADANGTLEGETSQTVNYGTSGTAITAKPNAHHHFVGWSDGSMANPRIDAKVAANMSVKANFAIDTYTLAYTADANGTLEGETSQTVNYGTSGTAITAKPDAHHHFVGWSDGSKANPRIDANVTTNVSATANFAIDTFTLVYTAGENGSLVGAANQTVAYGASGTAVMAVANTGHHFVSWSDGTTANPRTDSGVTADLSLTARFAIDTFTLVYTASANGKVDGQTAQTIKYMTSGSAVTAIPNIGCLFVAWSDGSVTNPRTDTNVTADIAVTANFALKTYAIDVSVDAAADSGMVDPGGKSATIMVGQGANQTFTITPYSGCRIADVLVDGVSVGSVTSYTFTAVSAAHTLKASFAAIAAEEFVITATAGFGGTVTPSGETVVVSGAGVPVAITPDSGYAIKNVWVDGVSIGAVYSYKFTAVSADHSLNASFSVSDGGQALRAVNGNSITLQVTPPPSGVTVWGCEELLPEGLTPDNITGSNGSWNAAKRKITWNGEGNASARLSYTVDGDAGTYVVSGGASFGDTTIATVGDSGVILSSLHPADQGGDWAIVMQEAISYVAGWQAGSNPMSYAARALYIWKNGEDYHFDASLDRPDCWVLGVANKAALKRVAAGTSERSVNATTNVVTIKVTPPAGALVWTCEEFLPEGLAAGNITGANRNYNDATGKISWYDFVVDTAPVELTYTVSGAPGSYSLDDGSAAFDGTVAQTSPGVTVVIAKQRFVITPAAGLGGSVSPDTAVTLDSGASQDFAMASDIGHHIADVLVDGSSVGSVASYKFANVTKNYTITASFALDTFNLEYAAGTGGTLSGATSQTVEYGASGSAVKAVPSVGYHFVLWSDGFTANPRTDSNITSNLSVTATFALNVYTLTFAATAGGSLGGQTTQSVEHGGRCSAVEAVAARGYSFTTWDNGFGTTNPLTVTNVTSDLTITATFAKKAKPEYWVAYGSVFTVNASDLEDSSPFAKAPKVVAYKDGKAGGKAKVLGFKKGATSVNCVWQGKDKPGTYTLLVNGETLTEEFVIENPNDFDVTLTPDTGVANDKITVTGSYFGSTCPKVTMEWQVESKGKVKTKKATCKVIKPYKYDDANGKLGKSVMYVGQEPSESGYQPGDSELTFIVPKGITESTPATLKLNCNGTSVERPFNPTK